MAELNRRAALSPTAFEAGRLPEVEGNTLTLDEMLFTGSFPSIHDRGLEASTWLDGYVRTYVERDVRTISNVGDLDAFLRFLGLCAG